MDFNRFYRVFIGFVFVFFISCSNETTNEGDFEPFSREMVRLSIEIIPAEGGVVYPLSGNYSKGDYVTLRPESNTGYYFSHWTGDMESTYHSETIMMDSNKFITAVFIEYRDNFPNPQE